MANKKISELAVRTPSLTDLMLVGDPSTGYSYKATLSALSTLLEANIALDDLSDVTITSPTAGQVLSYNGTAWVNDTNGITGSGTTNYIPKFTSATAIGNSIIYESSSNIGIGITTPSAKLDVNGNGNFSGGVYAAEVYLSSPNNIVGIVDSTNANGGFLQFSTSSTIIAEMGSSQSVIGSGGNNLFVINGKGARDLVLATNATDRVRIASTGAVTISTIANATTDTDKFIVSDGGVIKYRTGSEVLSDIGGAAASSISGTTNYIPKFTSSSAIGNSQIFDNGSSVGIGTATPSASALLELKSSGDVSLRINSSSASSGDLYITSVGSGNESRIDKQGGAGPLTFYNNGSERMRLDASGNLGLGISSPATRLHILGNGHPLVIASNEANIIYTTYRYNTSTDVGYIGNGVGAITGGAASDFGIAAATGNLLFAAGGVTERMRITSGGNVGIGTTSPASLFHVSGGNITLWNSSDAIIQSVKLGALATRITTTSSALTFGVDGSDGSTERMRITSGGNVGIGTTSPDAILRVAGTTKIGEGAAANTSKLMVNTTNGVAAGIQLFQDGVESWIIQNIASSTALTFGNSGTERLRITGGGDVGIGTTSPNALLHLVSATTRQIIESTTNSQNAGLYFTTKNASSTVQQGGMYYIPGTNPYLTLTGDNVNSHLNVTSGGNVGIGTTSPSDKLHVYQNADDNVVGKFEQAYSSRGDLLQFTNAHGTGYIGHAGDTSGDFSILNASNTNTYFTTNGSERMRITSGGNVLVGTTTNASGFSRLILNGSQNYSESGIQVNYGASTNGGFAITTLSAAGGGMSIYTYTGNVGSESYSERMRITSGGDVGIGTTTPGTKLEVNGAIKTAAPSGGTAKPFKIGAAATVTPTSQNRTIEIEIDGTTYYLTAKTTND